MEKINLIKRNNFRDIIYPFFWSILLFCSYSFSLGNDTQLSANDIKLNKDLLYNKYTLEDFYLYKDTKRSFQWDKIKSKLALVENMSYNYQWVLFSNYKNRNGEAPLVSTFRRNNYHRIVDSLGHERYQGIPLYENDDISSSPKLYGEDGAIAQLISDGDKFVLVQPSNSDSQWYVPKKYIKHISDTIIFNKVIIVDILNQNITTLDKKSKGEWLIRSMNPATTGKKSPPYSKSTPLGLFIIQEKKNKMEYQKDGSSEIAGFAPYASRFSSGGYIHGVPTNLPSTDIIEFSPTLGTIPLSHMCVRNASSHAKFIYEWALINGTIVFVID